MISTKMAYIENYVTKAVTFLLEIIRLFEETRNLLHIISDATPRLI